MSTKELKHQPQVTKPTAWAEKSWGSQKPGRPGDTEPVPLPPWNPGTTFCVCSLAQSCPTLLQPHGLQSARLLCPWDSPGKNTGVGYHFLFQGIFPTQVSNPGFLHCRCTLYHLSHLEKGAAAAAAKSLQSCPTLCDPIDGSPPGSPVCGILQARTLEWVAISFSNAWEWKVKVT